MGLLTVEGVVAGYHAADEILKGVDLAVDPGEIVSIIGPNGAGKSTLLKAIAGVGVQRHEYPDDTAFNHRPLLAGEVFSVEPGLASSASAASVSTTAW